MKQRWKRDKRQEKQECLVWGSGRFGARRRLPRTVKPQNQGLMLPERLGVRKRMEIKKENCHKPIENLYHLHSIILCSFHTQSHPLNKLLYPGWRHSYRQISILYTNGIVFSLQFFLLFYFQGQKVPNNERNQNGDARSIELVGASHSSNKHFQSSTNLDNLVVLGKDFVWRKKQLLPLQAWSSSRGVFPQLCGYVG